MSVGEHTSTGVSHLPLIIRIEEATTTNNNNIIEEATTNNNNRGYYGNNKRGHSFGELCQWLEAVAFRSEWHFGFINRGTLGHLTQEDLLATSQTIYRFVGNIGVPVIGPVI